jgi:uncharacterized peroxidase-related enzyme
MPWIETIAHADATGTLKDAYDWQAARLGEPTEFTQLGSLYPELVLERLRLYKVAEGAPSGLTPDERLLAALVTSNLNGTVHCASGLVVRLDELGVAADVVRRAGRPGEAPEDSRAIAGGDRRLEAILGYAAKLTSTPAAIDEADIERLRAVGLSDLDIVDLNNLVSYYNYINRVANGLGLRTPIEQRLHAVAALPAGAR